MRLFIENRPDDLEIKLKELSPWGHYFKFDEKTITGFFTKITTPENAVKNPENTFCTKTDSLEKINLFNKAYDEMITNSKRQFMLIDTIKKLLGNDFYNATAYDFGCNDGMKTFYLKNAGVKTAKGFEFREDCIKRANYIKSISNINCEFIHHPISAESNNYTKDIEPADIVASFGILHHLKDHKTHIEQLQKITKKILILHVAYTNEENKRKILIENCKENSFKSITGERILPTKGEIIDILYNTGFSYVLEILDHKKIDKNGFNNFMMYLIAVI